MAASKWHRITNVTDTDTAGSLTQKGGHVFRECDIALTGTTDAFTTPFDWRVNGDFTVIVNTGAVDINANYSGANCKLKVYGHTNDVAASYRVLLDTSAQLSFDETSDVYVYNFDEKGVLPYMWIALDGNGAGTETIKVAVIPH